MESATSRLHRRLAVLGMKYIFTTFDGPTARAGLSDIQLREAWKAAIDALVNRKETADPFLVQAKALDIAAAEHLLAEKPGDFAQVLPLLRAAIAAI